MMRPGIHPHYAAQAYDVRAGQESLTVFAPTRPIHHRCDALDGPLLTVTLSSPAPDIIRVRIVHFDGGGSRLPRFETNSGFDTDTKIELSDKAAEITSGRLTARVARDGEWRLDFLAEGKFLTSSGDKSLGYMHVEDECAFLHEQLQLDVGELVYGLGERFTPFVKNGQSVESWNRDAGAGSDHAYKSVPFYLTNRGYGVFVNHPGRVSFEVGSEIASRVQFSVAGEELEYFVIYGESPLEIISNYTSLTGRPALPPAWSFGLWLSTSFATDYNAETVASLLQEMSTRDIPVSVFHFDCFWMREFQWCDFLWDHRVFEDPAGMLRTLKESGLRISVWINPYIAQKSPLFGEAKENGYLLLKPDGEVWQTDRWQPGMAIVDFTNPAAQHWFAAQLHHLVGLGVDCFKTDFGEEIPTDVKWFDGSDPDRMHNYYAQLYNATVFEVLGSAQNRRQGIVCARSATAGGQKYPVHWGGDSCSTFSGMAASLRGGLSLSICGFGFWAHDVGGFDGDPGAELYKRWVAFGALSSHSRLHGSSSHRVPWEFDDEAVEVLRFFTKLKCRLMPYLYAFAIESSSRGYPMMRPMFLEFGESDPACQYLDRQYMLGDALLVAPVFSVDGAVEFYVPKGNWTSLISGKRVTGGRWRKETHGCMSLPLLVRPNTLLAIGADEGRPDYDYSSKVTLELYELEPGRSAVTSLPSIEGRNVGDAAATRVEDTLTIELRGRALTAKVLLVNIHEGTVDGAGMEKTERGILLSPRGETVTVSV